MRGNDRWMRGRAPSPSAAAGLAALVAAVVLAAASATPARADATPVRLEVGLGVAAPLTLGLETSGGGGRDKLIPVPERGLELELWADPSAGSIVYPGDRAFLYFRANADCYVTVFSVDTEGRVRLLYPGIHDGGYVEGRSTYRLPARGAGHNLVFGGPPGIEYIYAVASFEPMRHRYPHWMVGGRLADPSPGWWDGECDVWDSGWVVGDPFFRIRRFCEQLVPEPHRPERFATAYLYWHLGRHVAYPRYVCSDCHRGGYVDPYGPACVAVQVRPGDVRPWGWIDFRVVFSPCYTYEVWRTWRPRHWHGHDWRGPDGRWVWSSRDGRGVLRNHFRDATEVRWGDRGPGQGDPRGRDGREVRSESTPWGRSHEERIDRAVRELRGEREARESREAERNPADKPRNGDGTRGVEREERRPPADRPDAEGRPQVEPRKNEDRDRGDREVRGGRDDAPRSRPEGRGSEDRGRGKDDGSSRKGGGQRDSGGREGRGRSR